MTTKGWCKEDFIELADIIDEALRGYAEDLRKYEIISAEMWEDYKKTYIHQVRKIIEKVSINGR